MIFEFDNTTSFLKSTLELKSRDNASYSMRAFAKRLGYSAGGLSMILSKKKKISVERGHEVAQALQLNEKETEYFIALIHLESAKSPTLRMKYLEKIKELNPLLAKQGDMKKSLLSLEHFKLISEWYGLAILELVTAVKGSWTAASVAKKLGLTRLEAELVLERLMNLEMIEVNAKGLYQRCVDTLMVEAHVPNEALRLYYEGLHRQSLQSVRSQSPQEKIIGSQVFAFDPSNLEEVRTLTYKYLDDLNEIAMSGKKKTELYQALTNVFKLSQKDTI
jgi:uncharacterized protein (TIGR02147 family)